ncbi:alpha/beta fold hydrolase [Sciscionella sediminilitoris]|uniref:alpha/beta fold hydrolase n=1 Tax=Sciscionella sediminilitoris TaxID=1445613 RepID=UPI0009EB468B|nr:alpha/beta hydrolase [Sciscionella sp. SE31]
MTAANGRSAGIGGSHGGRRRTARTVDGQRWHYVEAGDLESDLTVVLIAGYPQSAYAWRHVLPVLGERFRTIAIDLPGQGYSAAPADGFDTGTSAARVRGLLTHLGVGKHVYVGHDVGAWVGFAYAHQQTADLEGVVLIDANIAGVTLPSSIPLGQESWRSWHFLFNAVPDLPEALLAGRERVLIEWFFAGKAEHWKDTFTEADIDEYVRTYQTPGVLRGMLGYYRAVVRDAELHAELVREPTKVPVLAVAGDRGSAPDLPEKLRPLIPDLRGEIISESGHYIPEEQPEALIAAIRRFIDEVRR